MNLIPFGRENGSPGHRDFGFDTLQREVDRVFDTFARGIPVFGRHSAFPSIDVVEVDKEIEIWCELPGLEEKDVQVSLADGILTIEGEKHAERESSGRSHQIKERTYGAFTRSLPVPTNLEAESVKATMKNGVLKVTVTKPKSSVAQHIEVRSAH